MQTLYGHHITDRITVDYEAAHARYTAKFDGEVVGHSHTGAGAVAGAIEWLKRRKHEKEKAEAQAAEEEAALKWAADIDFLDRLAFKLGIHSTDLDELIEVVKRRIAS